MNGHPHRHNFEIYFRFWMTMQKKNFQKTINNSPPTTHERHVADYNTHDLIFVLCAREPKLNYPQSSWSIFCRLINIWLIVSNEVEVTNEEICNGKYDFYDKNTDFVFAKMCFFVNNYISLTDDKWHITRGHMHLQNTHEDGNILSTAESMSS